VNDRDEHQSQISVTLPKVALVPPVLRFTSSELWDGGYRQISQRGNRSERTAAEHKCQVRRR
jgi:hypothetical protein